jgi:hypothetical protein
VIKYYIEIADANGNKKWDNNNGQNFSITVKPPVGAWVRSVQNFPVDGEVTEAEALYINAEAGPSNTLSSVRTGYSTNGTTWVVTNMTLNAAWGSDGGNWFNVGLGTFPAGSVVRYYVEALGTTTNRNDNGGLNYQVTVRSLAEDLWIGNARHSPTNGAITAADTITITSETWPAGVATNVAMAYSTDGGATWSLQNLAWTMTNNNNDIWSVGLGSLCGRYGGELRLGGALHGARQVGQQRRPELPGHRGRSGRAYDGPLARHWCGRQSGQSVRHL